LERLHDHAYRNPGDLLGSGPKTTESHVLRRLLTSTISVKLGRFIHHHFTVGLQSKRRVGGLRIERRLIRQPGGIVRAVFSHPADAVRARALSRPTVLPKVRRGRRRKRKKHLRGDRAHPAFLALRRMRSRVRHRRHLASLAAAPIATSPFASTSRPCDRSENGRVARQQRNYICAAA
jgi:hypothetical protein